MGFIIGLFAAGALLVRWLLGGPIARVLVFVALMPVLFVLTDSVAGKILSQTATPSAWFGIHLLLFGAIAWFISGIPAYVWRHRLRDEY